MLFKTTIIAAVAVLFAGQAIGAAIAEAEPAVPVPVSLIATNKGTQHLVTRR